jgi:putative DNA primase/helicase
MGKLAAEASGILNWIVAGARSWNRIGLDQPAKLRAVVREYRDDMDVLGLFLREQTQAGAGQKVGAQALYGAFRNWMESGGERSWTKRAFNREMESRGYERRRDMPNGAGSWQGLRLVESLTDPISVVPIAR